MNFLAHLFLSGTDDDIKIGNYIGDFVKGNQLEEYPDEIKAGIIHHRNIDHYTDTHPVVLQSKKRLRPKYRHYSPVIVDMYYDHFLASNWEEYAETDLKEYTTAFYKMAWSKSDILPPKVINLLTHMSLSDWLYNYREMSGLDRALKGMAQRTKFNSKMEMSIHDLEENYDSFLQEFQLFFPQLIKNCFHG